MELKTSPYLLQTILFVASFGLIVLIIQWSRTAEPPVLTQDDASGITTLSRGQVVTLPEVARLDGGSVSLGSLREKHLLVGFISCSACAKESTFWQSLHEEATRRNVAFYLIAIDKEYEDLEKFANAYGFEDLPVLIDRTGAVAKAFAVSHVPMYVLVTSEGQVRDRWIGLSHTNADNQRAKEPAQFFTSL